MKIMRPQSFEEFLADEFIETTEPASPIQRNDENLLKRQKMEEVMTKGLQFLAGFYEISAGNKLDELKGAKVEYDDASGEMVFRFKI